MLWEPSDEWARGDPSLGVPTAGAGLGFPQRRWEPGELWATPPKLLPSCLTQPSCDLEVPVAAWHRLVGAFTPC